MSVSRTITASMRKLDPLKRVNYTFGLVLGVDEFLQEQTHLAEKDRSQYRLAHGYGTVCGLGVRIDSATMEVRIAPGVAINPQGREIRVPREMCARLNDWLVTNKDALEDSFGLPPFNLSLCVVLCYRECETDVVPVPGEPCRTQQDATAASRIAESFELKLCVNEDSSIGSPMPSLPEGLRYRTSQFEEDAIREFGKLLGRVRITDSAMTFVTQQELEDLVRQVSAQPSAPVASPAWNGGTLHLHPDDASDFLRAAFRVWVTEVRPVLYSPAESTCCEPPAEQCVLLADLDLAVDASWQVSGSVQVDQVRRPILVQTRVLQESLFGGLKNSGANELGQGPVIVAAGAFRITGTNVSAIGPTYNGLTAVYAGTASTYLLRWQGGPSYGPVASPPTDHAYIVLGTPMLTKNKTPRFTFEVVEFLPDAIKVRVRNAPGGGTAAGFMVEIKEIVGAE